MRETPPGREPYEIADTPAPARSRGWHGLDRDREELAALAGAVGLIVLAALGWLVGGAAGMTMVFLLLTLVIFVVLMFISRGG